MDIKELKDWHRAEAQRYTSAFGVEDIMARWHFAAANLLHDMFVENERFRTALYSISLMSQNSMSSKEDCGRRARAATQPMEALDARKVSERR